MSKELYLYNPIFSFVAEDLITAMEENSAQDIVIRVNSPGGSVNAGWGIIAKMQERSGKTTMKVDGAAMSMAAVALLFADRVEALDVSTIMLHRADMYIESPEDQKYLDQVNATIRAKMEKKINAEVFKNVTGHEISEMFSGEKRLDVFLTAKQAKEIGLVTAINKVNPKEIEAFNNKYFKIAAEAEPIKIDKKMDLSKLKAEHPEVYALAVAEGVAKEKSRVEVWAHYAEVDPKAVNEGIKSGKEITQLQIVELTEKKFNGKALKGIESENANPIKTEADKTTGDNSKDADAKAKAEFDKALDEQIKKFNKR